jgi:hypothetical protein
MIDLKKGNVEAAIIAVVVCSGLLFFQQRSIEKAHVQKQAALVSEPPITWFEVKNVAVPNFIAGTDPQIIYDRTVHKPFSATWNVEVHLAGDKTDFSYCTGSGVNNYEPSPEAKDANVLLSWFIGKDCHLPPGQYLLQTNWEIRPEGYPTKRESYSSNLFRVLPVGSELYVTPSQVKKLDSIQ